jgi:hypothetical protein
MADTVEDICNQALGMVGVTTFIEGLADDSIEARACSRYYASRRDLLLEHFPWPFAEKTATLVQIAGFTPVRYAFAYGLPTDCLKVRELWSGIVRPRVDEKLTYGFQNYLDAKVLITNESAPKLVYTARIENPRLFSASFGDALAAALALRLAQALPSRLDYVESARRQYAAALHSAAESELGEQQIELEPDSELIGGGV